VRRAPITGLALSVLSAVAVAGCGSGSSNAGTKLTPSPSPSSSQPSVSAVAPATAAQLQAIVLQATDLPAGWSGATHQADPSDAASSAAFAACLGVRNTYPDKAAHVDSQDFTQGNTTIVSTGDSFKSPSDVQSDVASLTSPKLVPCLKQQAASGLSNGQTLDSFDLTFTPGSGGGPSNIVATISGSFTVTDSGQQQKVYLTSVYITGPSIETDVNVQSDAPIPAALVSGLAAKVAARSNTV
jgi:hypothetical protein